MNKKLLVSIAAAFLIITSCNTNQGNDSEKVADKKNEQKADSSATAGKIEDDSKFVVKATSGVTMEVKLGKYAEQNAVSPAVKNFGATMLKDHSKDKEELTKLAAAKNITIPAVTGEDFQKHIDEITSKKGADFDKAYISFMVSDHKDDISEFEKEVKDGQDAEIKAFASKGIPVLQHHLDMAKSINDQLK